MSPCGLAITGEPDGGPLRAGVAMADLSTGMYATVAILAFTVSGTLAETGVDPGTGLAAGAVLLLLGMVALIARMTEPVFSIFGQGFSWRDLILLAVGLVVIGTALVVAGRRAQRPASTAAAKASGASTIG